MTLIEVVVTISVMGAIATVLAAAVTVTFRQQADTDSNLDIARWEQALALWMPTDLASADPDTMSDDPTASPGCSEPECTQGSNALSLSYDDGSGTTNVSYRYIPDDRGDGYRLVRIECQGGCTIRTVLRDLAAPEGSWTAGDPVPSSVMNVSVPDPVDGTDPSADPGAEDMRARTISVSVNGLPDQAGTSRSSLVTVTAGGVTRGDLELPSFEGPSFIEARSGCGGPVTLLVDDSGSVVSEAGSFDPVRQGVESFVRAFEGTPTDLTVIRFDSVAGVLGTTDWTRSFDLAEPTEVFELVGDSTLGSGGYLGDIGRGGGTDWKEALQRAFQWSDGTSYADLGNPNYPAPELVVFFTDGLPTYDDNDPSVTIPAAYNGNGHVYFADGTPMGPPSGGQWFTNLSVWYRANDFLEQYRSSARVIGVGISQPFEQGVVHVPTWLPGWSNYQVPVRVFLGDMVAGLSTPPAYDGTPNFELVEYDATDGWGDVSTAHVLTTQDMSNLGSGLAAIALAECGGTLTVQTRESSGDSADADISYAMGGEQVTTSRINKAATFDVGFGGAASKTVQLYPQSFDGTGYAPVSWSCKAGGVALAEGSDWSLISAGNPGDGINVTVTPNAAVSCTLEVA